MSRHANAQRRGMSSRPPLTRRAASRDRARTVDGAGTAQSGGQHHLTLSPVPRRRDGLARGQFDRFARHCARRSRRRRRPSPARPRPTPAHRQPARHRPRRQHRLRARQQRRRGGKRPTPSASAASPISASPAASGRRPPAPARGRPSRGRGHANPTGAETTPACCGPATPAGPTGRPGQRCKIGIRAAVASLSPGGDRPQPALVRSRRVR